MVFWRHGFSLKLFVLSGLLVNSSLGLGQEGQRLSPLRLSRADVFRDLNQSTVSYDFANDNTAWSVVTDLSRFLSSSPFGGQLTIEWRLRDAQVEWEQLEVLNRRAGEAWQLLRSCSSAGAEEAIRAYRDNQVCPRSHDFIRQWKRNVREFLASTSLNEFFPTTFHSCMAANSRRRGSGPQEGACGQLRQELSFSLQKEASTAEANDARVFLDAAIDAAPKPQLHPFFVQVLLESLAATFPFPRVISDCVGTGLFPWQCPEPRFRLVSASLPNDRYGDFVYDRAHEQALRNLEAEGRVGISRSEQLLWLGNRSIQGATLEHMRSALVALRILAFFLPRRDVQNCAVLGFWPSSATDLLFTLGQASSTLGRKERARLERWAAMGCRVASSELEALAMFRPPPRLTMEALIQALSRVEAWQELAHSK